MRGKDKLLEIGNSNKSKRPSKCWDEERAMLIRGELDHRGSAKSKGGG